METKTITYALVECYKCSMPFYTTDYFDKRRREDHQTFWCPAGHPQCYTGKSEAEKLRDQLNKANNMVLEVYRPWIGYHWEHEPDCAIEKHIRRYPGIQNFIEYSSIIAHTG